MFIIGFWSTFTHEYVDPTLLAIDQTAFEDSKYPENSCYLHRFKFTQPKFVQSRKVDPAQLFNRLDVISSDGQVLEGRKVNIFYLSDQFFSFVIVYAYKNK